MEGEAGKGSDPRPVNRKKWDACPLWKNSKKRKKTRKKNK